MPTTLTFEEIVPEMDLAPLYLEHPALYEEACDLFPCFFYLLTKRS